ncbi:CD276 antigen homolog [Rhinichthys klamathensis goyatoka]|uniref:CD276 antigen homolog n=1 Tax=Rhinichthys klamathensis goyatoka TaxID=3034132 RepID=UPI0024B5A496|nr:CD276 antigen homolog [Rhinichthys klamathensis goyatoka]
MVITEASLVTVKGLIGGSVVLPCSSEEPQLTVQDITVNWKYHDRLKVLDIIKGKGSGQGQDQSFKNRTETFPEEYTKGNFSLKLKNLQHSDRGKYQCYITEESVIRTVELFIEVPVRDPVVGFIGGSAVLPCSAKERQLTTEDITVSWRHNKTLEVFDIIKGKVSVEEQDSVFKNRTETFPQEYLKGNFSLKLNNLQLNDTGIYKCYIRNELLIHSVKLEINQGAQSRPEKILLVVPFLSVSILLFM